MPSVDQVSPEPSPPAHGAVPGPVRAAARRLLAAAGWRVDVTWPPSPRCVVIVYPHTSNLDFFIGYLAKLASGLPLHWLGKDTIFRWPVAGLLRRMGGIPVNRRERTGLIGQLAGEFERRPHLWLAIAPEGTRAYVDHLKSGFYRLAVEAHAPLGLAFIDYRRRVVGLDTFLTLTGDEEADLARIRAFYAGKVGRYPAQAGAIRFRRDADHQP